MNIRKYTLFAIALVISFSTFSGIFRLSNVVYIGAVAFFLLISYIGKISGLRIGDWTIVGFILISVLSILINDPPEYFRSWERLLLFILILMAFSPLVTSRNLSLNRWILFDSLLKIMVVFSVASFIGYFFGINFFIRHGDLLAYDEAGHFSGFTSHSMILAPISSFSSIYAFGKIMQYKNRKRLLWTLVALCSIGAMLLSASRGAIGALIFSSIVVLYKFNSKNKSRFVKYMLIISGVLAMTFPIWGGLTQYVIEKNEYNISEGGVVYSREDKMAARFYEIKNKPLTGVGFATVDESVDEIDRNTGTIEPNSSWLGVFSMTGIFGFLFFLAIFVKSFLIAYNNIKNPKRSALLCGFLAFFFVHMMIEGYVLAGGSILCGMYWLTIGVTQIFAKNRSSKIYRKKA